MKRLLVLVSAVAVAGCGDPKPDDPTIKAQRRVEFPGGRVDTPVGGGGYDHGGKGNTYEGPYSKAPAWAKE